MSESLPVEGTVNAESAIVAVSRRQRRKSKVHVHLPHIFSEREAFVAAQRVNQKDGLTGHDMLHHSLRR